MSARALRRIYLDHQASTPCDPRVIEAMLQCLASLPGNPSSAHWAGDEAEAALENARAQVSSILACEASEVVFTSGATESNNLAILGLARNAPERRRRIVTTAIEHQAVLMPCEYLSRNGFEVAICPVMNDGMVDLGALMDLVDETTLLVSVHLANNEIGTLQPVREIAQIAHRVGAAVHTDAAQGFCRVQWTVDDLDIDLASISGHKCYGPKGVGALFVRGGFRSGALARILFGGEQEGGLRPGTPNIAGAVGLGAAAQIASRELEAEIVRVRRLRDWFEDELSKSIKGVRFNGHRERRLPGCSSVTLPDVDSEAILARVPTIAWSAGAACHSRTPAPSHVLTAVGLSARDSLCTLRVGIGRFTSLDEIRVAVVELVRTVGVLGSRQRTVSAT